MPFKRSVLEQLPRQDLRDSVEHFPLEVPDRRERATETVLKQVESLAEQWAA
jgi:surfactin synthase thioesterase subunit